MLADALQTAAQDTSATQPLVPGWSTVSTWLNASPIIGLAIGLTVLVLVAWIANDIARRYILRLVRKLVRRTQVTWDDRLLEHNVFRRLANVVPAVIIYYGILLVPGLTNTFTVLIQRIALAVAVIVVVIAASALLNAINDIYSRRPDAAHRPIKGYLQIVKIFLFIVAIILVVSQLVGRSPVVFLSGIGAMTAVLLLIFRDTILSFVASIQIAMNDTVRLGDWIEMPKYGADGDVIDIALHTIKIQNWDKTITSIPTHKLIDDSFKNWRGMSESGGRRIKRAVNIDMSSVRFLEPDEIERFGKWELLRNYVSEKRAALGEFRAGKTLEAGLVPHERRMTNLETFRAYVVNYLRDHPKTHLGMTLIVRQMDPTPHGVPLQLYVFSNDTDWVRYEGFQSDIFEHLLATLPDFGLRVFQEPTGSDVQALRDTKPPAAPGQA